MGLLAACSLDVPKHDGGGSLKIKVEDVDQPKLDSAALIDQLSALWKNSLGLAMLTGPSVTSDFTCFAANVTGEGIASLSSKLQGCTSPSNMRGVGVGAISDTVPRGGTIQLDITSGKNRTIDVYGVFPPDQGCGASSGSSGSSGSTGGNGGYFLGRVVRDIGADTSVTVPISYGGGAADVTCTGGGNNGGGGGNTFQFNKLFPYGGRTSGGFQITLGGALFSGPASVTVNGNACTSVTVVSSSTITCIAPAGTTGSNLSVVLTNGGGQTATQNFFSYQTGSAFVAYDNNTNNTDFGNVAYPSHRDLTLTFQNTGDTGTSTLAAPSPALPGQFTIVGGTCSFPGTTLAANSDQSCTVILRFTPSGPSAGPASTSPTQFFSAGAPTITFNATGT